MTNGVDLLVHRVTQSEITMETGNTSLGGGLHLNGTKRENTQKIVGGKKKHKIKHWQLFVFQSLL